MQLQNFQQRFTLPESFNNWLANAYKIIWVQKRILHFELLSMLSHYDMYQHQLEDVRNWPYHLSFLVKSPRVINGHIHAFPMRLGAPTLTQHDSPGDCDCSVVRLFFSAPRHRAFTAAPRVAARRRRCASRSSSCATASSVFLQVEVFEATAWATHQGSGHEVDRRAAQQVSRHANTSSSAEYLTKTTHIKIGYVH